MSPIVPRLVRVLPLLFAVLALAGCAGLLPATPTPAIAPSPTPVATTPAPTPAAVVTPVPPSATPALPALTLWVAEEGPALELVRELASAFATETGIPITVLARPADGLRLSLATAELLGEAPPDLLWGDQEALAGLRADGRIQPVGLPAPADTLPALRTAASADNVLWGVPLSAQGALLLLYNRTLVDAAPATSDELIVRSRAATTSQVAGMVAAWDEARWLLPWLYAFGGAPLSPDGQTISLETPELVAALGLLRELYVAAPTDDAGYRRGQRLFAQGYAAFALDGDWAVQRYRMVSDTLELGIAPLPLVPATGRPALAPLGGSFLLFHRDLAGEARTRARAFATWLLEPAIQARLARGLGRLPARSGVLASSDLTADPALAAAAAGATLAPGLPPTQAARCMLDAIDVWLPNVLNGSLDQAEAPARMQREADACLARFAGGL
ncbi:MAG: extracellular solute-binding protein [Chloroflexi bacterium]|nr:extracellular solute-binding protein [Chloroflexota bacterium]